MNIRKLLNYAEEDEDITATVTDDSILDEFRGLATIVEQDDDNDELSEVSHAEVAKMRDKLQIYWLRQPKTDTEMTAITQRLRDYILLAYHRGLVQQPITSYFEHRQ